MIKVIVFDLGNVLYRFNPLLAAEGLAKITGLRLTPLQILRFFEASNEERKYCEGKISTEEFYRYVLEQLKIQCSLEEFQKVFCNIFNEMPESFSIVQELRQEGYPLFLLSNTNELHYEHLYARHSVLQSFDEVILSYQVNCQKPDVKIFEILIEKAGCEPKQIFFIDDLEENVNGAEKLGIQGHHFKGISKLRKDLTERKILDNGNKNSF